MTGAQPDPQVQQKKQEEDQKRKAWALKVIDWNKNLEAAQAKVRQEETQKRQVQNQQEEKAKEVKQFQLVKKQQKQMNVAQVAERRTEIKKGVGG